MKGMIARTEIAILDFNSGASCEQAETKSGKKRFKLQYSRVSNNWVTKPIKSKKEKTFITDILEKIKTLRINETTVEMPDVSVVPKCMYSDSKPNKEEALKIKVSRFNKRK